MKKDNDPLEDIRKLLRYTSDPMKEHREMMAALGDPLKEHREMMAAMADPLKEHREMMAVLGDPLKEHREMMAAMADPLKEHREMMEVLGDPLKEHREMIAALGDPLKEHREMMAAMGNPLKDHREMIAAMADPLKEFRESIAAIQNPFKNLSAAIASIDSLRLLKDVALDIGQNLSFEPDGQILFESKRLAISELQSLSYQVIHDSSVEPSGSLEESLNNLVDEIRAQRDPAIQKLLMWFICPLIIAVIVSFLNPVVDCRIKSYLSEDKRSLSKKIESKAAASVVDRFLTDFRYVSADVLNVRYSASKKAETVGYLHFGYAVIVISREKNWTLIEWSDPDSEIRINGWVFSRYLAKFK
ncbi:SH3 domain-containing protein [uncultured Salinicola sp.]|uniref:SH3 domain-containing protein n=1 Tax=uncultured Salinicola sp. TaxID=1193542 RepID=UPI0026073A33|nr:SH3 domain-containing protein [uncultured Salinicola sp.]|tara:strand:- start:793 stop:1869 length:1077 start_codon:yes stop_codon:yes gene_type:complete